MYEDNTIVYKGTKYTKEQFMSKYGWKEDAIDRVIGSLSQKGIVKLIGSNGNDRDAMDKALAEEAAVEEGNQIEFEERQRTIQEAINKSDEIIPSIEILYDTMHDAEAAGAKIQVKYGLSCGYLQRDGKNYLIVYNVPDSIIDTLEREYKLDRAVQSGVRTLDKGINAVGEALDYGLNDVGVPVAKSAMKLGGKVAKAAARLVGKTSSSAVNITAQTARETSFMLSEDPDVRMARREIINIKDGLKRTFGGGKATSGFTINR